MPNAQRVFRPGSFDDLNIEILEADFRQVFNVLDFGAKGDGVTDDTAAIQACFDAALAADDARGADANHPSDLIGGAAVVTLIGYFLITKQVTCRVNLDASRATFLVQNTPAVALQWGTGGNANILTGRFCYAPQLVNVPYVATQPSVNTPGIGLLAINAANSLIVCRKIESFQKAIVCRGDGNGFAWNRVYLNWFVNNANSFWIEAINSGYCNENQIFGGSFAIFTGTAIPGTSYIHIDDNVGANPANNLTFFGPALEGDGPAFHVYNAGRYTTIYNGRWEDATAAPRIMYSGNGAGAGCDNTIFLGIPPTFNGSFAISTQGAGVARNVSIYNGGLGLQHNGPMLYDIVNSQKATMVIDDTNHRVGLGTVAPNEQVSIKTIGPAGVNVSFDDWAYVGETYSQQDLVLGYNAKADQVNQVGGQVVAAQANAGGFRFVKVGNIQGVEIHVSNSAVSQGDILTNLARIARFLATGLVLDTVPAFTAGAKYLVIDGAGNVRVSAIGPAS